MTSITDLANNGNKNKNNMDSVSRDRNRALSWGYSDRISNEIPKFKPFPPSSLPLYPPPLSPSSYLTIPPGLSPTDLLSSPMFPSNYFNLPSPTTGSFSGEAFQYMTDSDYNRLETEEEKFTSDFSFQPQTNPPTISSSLFESSSTVKESSKRQQEAWDFTRPTNQTEFPLEKVEVKSEFAPIKSFTSELASSQAKMQSSTAPLSCHNQYPQQPDQYIRQQRKTDDGYNWRKYGQKNVKGSENPRSYYKCSYRNCPMKKIVETSLDGQITEIVYKGSHNHPKPQSNRRSSSRSIQTSSCTINSGILDQSTVTLGNTQMESVTKQEDSSVSVGEDEFDQRSPTSDLAGNDNENEPEAKRWNGENENEGLSASGSRTVREPRVVVQTNSETDILDDGYKWRKYGQKVVKGNPNPRNYYKCTYIGCLVRKRVERASHDTRAVITTYEGKHNHDVPEARGSGNYAVTKPPSHNNSSNVPMLISSSVMATHLNQTSYSDSFQNTTLPTSWSQASYTPQMLQGPGGVGLSGYTNQNHAYMDPTQRSEAVLSRSKDGTHSSSHSYQRIANYGIDRIIGSRPSN